MRLTQIEYKSTERLKTTRTENSVDMRLDVNHCYFETTHY